MRLSPLVWKMVGQVSTNWHSNDLDHNIAKWMSGKQNNVTQVRLSNNQVKHWALTIRVLNIIKKCQYMSTYVVFNFSIANKRTFWFDRPIRRPNADKIFQIFQIFFKFVIYVINIRKHQLQNSNISLKLWLIGFYWSFKI